MSPVQLAVGDEVWCLICAHETGDKGRRTVEGTGFGRVEARADVGESERYDVRLERATRSSAHMIGRVVTVRRGDLFARRSPQEHAAFGATVQQFWGRNQVDPPMTAKAQPPCAHDWMALTLGRVFCRTCSMPLPADAPRCRAKHDFYFAHCGHITCRSCGHQRDTDKPPPTRTRREPADPLATILASIISTSEES